MTVQLRSGDEIGRYRIERLLGSGAMGDVYLAQDPRIERLLAIKTVRIAGSRPDDIAERKERLLREAKAAGRLIHPNVVTLFDTGEDRGLVFLAFEFVEGCDLNERLGAQPTLSLADALRIVRQTASALEAAHAQGVIHRDIKPSNILVTLQGDAKIADFGIAKMAGQSTELTTSGAVIGSPQYMSPEQIRGEALDGRTDLFSLGSVLYEVLTGRRAFPGETITTLVYQILNEDPQDVAELRADLPLSVVRLVRRMMSRDRDARSQSAAEVVGEIEQIEAQLSEVEAGLEATKLMPASGSSVPPPPPPVPPVGSPPVSPVGSPPVSAGAETPAPPLPTLPSPLPASAPPEITSRAAQSASRRSRVPLLLAVAFALFAVLAIAGVMLLRQWLSSTVEPEAPAEVAEASIPPAVVSDDGVTDRVASEVTRPPASEMQASEMPSSEAKAQTEEPARNAPDSGSRTARPASSPPAEVERKEPEPRQPEPASASATTSASAERTERPSPPPASPKPEPEAAAETRADETRVDERESSSATAPVVAAQPSPPEAAPTERRSPPPLVNARRTTGLTLTFDIEPEGAFVLFRSPDDRRFTLIGPASDYSGRKNQRFALPGAGTFLVMLRAEDYGDYVIEIQASSGGSTEPIRARLSAPGVQITTAREGDRFRVREAVAFADPPARARVVVDGQSRGPVRSFDGTAGKWLRLTPGVHEIKVEGRQRALTFTVEVDPSAAQPRLLLTAANP